MEPTAQGEKGEEEESLFGAAYEDMTYHDSTDDDVEGEVLDFMPQKDFDLAQEAERLEKRLKFLATLARLWNVATRALRGARASRTPCPKWKARPRTGKRGCCASNAPSSARSRPWHGPGSPSSSGSSST